MAQILIFGDSITDGSSDTQGGWADRFKRFLWAKNVHGEIVGGEYFWVYNLGISGNMTADVLKRIQIESLARKAERKNKGIVFIFAIGINDAVLIGDKDPEPRVSEEAFASNYQQLISFAQKYTDKILCIGLTPVDEKRTRPIYDDYWYLNNRIQKFNSIANKVARQNNVKFIEINEPFAQLPDYEGFLDDGLHPNDNGHEWMYEYIKPYILRALDI